MDYMTVRRAAEKWNLSPRSVQQLCTPVSYTHLTLPTKA